MTELTYPIVELKLTSPEGKPGKDLHPWLRSLSFTASVDGLDQLHVGLSVPALEKSDFPDLCFLPGGTYEVTFKDVDSKGSGKDVTYRGDIIKVDHSLTDGRWTLKLTGSSPLQRLRGRTVTHQPEDGTTRDDSIKKLLDGSAKILGAKPKIGGAKSTHQADLACYLSPQLGLLKKIAEETETIPSYDSKAKKLVLAKRGTGPTVELVYGRDISGVTLNLDLSDQPSEIHVTANGAPEPAKVASPTIDVEPAGQDKAHMGLALSKKAFGIKVVEVSKPDGDGMVGLQPNKKSMVAFGTQELAKRSRKFATGGTTSRGKPMAVANGLVKIKDAPWPLGGTFVIESVTHSWSPDEGFQSEISFYANAVAKKPS